MPTDDSPANSVGGTGPDHRSPDLASVVGWAMVLYGLSSTVFLVLVGRAYLTGVATWRVGWDGGAEGLPNGGPPTPGWAALAVGCVWGAALVAGGVSVMVRWPLGMRAGLVALAADALLVAYRAAFMLTAGAGLSRVEPAVSLEQPHGVASMPRAIWLWGLFPTAIHALLTVWAIIFIARELRRLRGVTAESLGGNGGR